MDSRWDSTVESREKVSISIISALVSAIHEWLLILLLFIDASFVYMVTRFASSCQLQIPCLLCSRLDHVFGSKNPEFVWDLMCHQHKLKISSLFFCRIHKKLVDIHGTCESCFFSFATMNKSNTETYRLLVGKLGDGSGYELEEDTFPSDYENGSCNLRNCCCCNGKWMVKTPAQMMFQHKKTEKPEENSPMIRAYWSSDELMEVKEGSFHSDPLCHVAYKKVKVNSDSESESQMSDGVVTSTLVRVIDTSEQDSVAPLSTVRDSDSNGISVHECGEDDTKKDAILQSDLISFTNSIESPSPSPVGPRFDDVIENDSSNIMDLGLEVSKMEKEVVSEPRIAARLDMRTTSDTGSQQAESLDLGDAYRLAIGTRGRQLSGKFLERQTSMQESNRASEDLKLLLSQISASRGVELSFNDISPRVRVNNEDYGSIEGSNSTGMQIPQTRFSLDRNESNISIEGSIISEIEGESVSDRLKRQIEQDKKIMGALYKELEEERNAAAIAANQAMAMITRLQEEKAAINMEALQYLRMMEEQAEYDNEAFQKLNDILAEKEKQIQDMEVELEQSKSSVQNLDFSDNSIEESSKYEAGKSVAGKPEQFEHKKNYILKSLKELEKKLYELSTNEDDRDMNMDDFTESELNIIRDELSAISKRLNGLEKDQSSIEISNI